MKRAGDGDEHERFKKRSEEHATTQMVLKVAILTYISQVENKTRNQPEIYADFLDIYKKYKSEGLGIAYEFIQFVTHLFRDYPELIEGLNLFFPPSYNIAVYTNEQVQVSIPDRKVIINPFHHTAENCSSSTPMNGFPLKLKRIDICKRTQLYNAARDGNIDKVEALVNENVCVNFKCEYCGGCSPLHVATLNKHFQISLLLVKAGADCNVLNKKKWTPLFCAVKGDSKELVEILVTAGAFVNLRDEKGNTPLAIAAQNGNYEISLYLLKAGADCNISDCQNRTPLFCAVDDGNLNLVEAFVKAGAKIDLKDFYQNTPLIIATRKGYFKIVLYLLEFGADCNVKGENDATPLHWAATEGRQDLIEVFVRRGALLNVIDKNGYCPFWLTVNSYTGCELSHYLDILIYLIKAGAKPYSYVNHCYDNSYLMDIDHIFLIKYYVLYSRHIDEPVFFVGGEFNYYYDTYKTEVENMKNTYFNNSYLSVLKFLKEKDSNKLINYLAIDGVTEMLMVCYPHEKYPSYYSMIKEQFQRARKRSFSIKNIEFEISKCSLKVLPYNTREIIFSFLEIDDLARLEASLDTSLFLLT